MPPRQTRKTISTPTEVSGEISGTLTQKGVEALTRLATDPVTETKDKIWEEYALATLPFEQKYKERIDEAADHRAKAIASAYEAYQTAVASATAVCDQVTTLAFRDFAVDTDELRRQRDRDLDELRRSITEHVL